MDETRRISPGEIVSWILTIILIIVVAYAAYTGYAQDTRIIEVCQGIPNEYSLNLSFGIPS